MTTSPMSSPDSPREQSLSPTHAEERERRPRSPKHAGERSRSPKRSRSRSPEPGEEPERRSALEAVTDGPEEGGDEPPRKFEWRREPASGRGRTDAALEPASERPARSERGGQPHPPQPGRTDRPRHATNARDGGGGGGGGGGFAGGTPPPPVCYDFLKGRCTRGPACRFAHDGNPDPNSNPNPSPSP